MIAQVMQLPIGTPKRKPDSGLPEKREPADT
jgi:hypothetical protein